jgi:stalled ribosome rescue protein Dom34
MNKLKLGAVDKVLVSDEMDDKEIEKFEEEAKNMGSEMVIISTETREGVQLKEMGGVAAILRYEVKE